MPHQDPEINPPKNSHKREKKSSIELSIFINTYQRSLTIVESITCQFFNNAVPAGKYPPGNQKTNRESPA
jgi:hypothetical protein